MKSLTGDWLLKKITRWLTQNTPPRRTYLCDFDKIRYELRPGDVLLIEGRNRISRFIRKVTQSPWSHAALFIGRLYDIDDSDLRERVAAHFQGPSDNQLLIESMIGKGTIITPLSFYRHDHIRICRPQGISRNDAQQVIGYAVTRLGGRYNIRHVVDLARFLLPWGYFRRWRSFLFEQKTSQTIYDICSSMIAEAFNAVNFPVLPIVKHDEENGLELVQRNPRLYTPSDFDYSPYFDIIKYPFFSLTQKAPYHHLPWREGAISIDEEREIFQHSYHQGSVEEPKNKAPVKTKYSESLSDLLNRLKQRKTPR